MIKPSLQAKGSCYACNAALTKRDAKFCGRDCYDAYRMEGSVTLTCEHCAAPFERTMRFIKSYVRRTGGTQRFCSKACAGEAKIAASPGKWRYVDKQGYIVQRHKGVLHYEHRRVMEAHLGRSLTATETVHHRDGDRQNNAIENLELWSKVQPSGQRVADKVAFAIDMLKRYPEVAAERGAELTIDFKQFTAFADQDAFLAYAA